MTDERLHAPAVQRNRDVIASCLRGILPAHGLVLEVASGTGEHVVHFAALWPGLVFQPSDRDPSARASIDAWVEHARLANVRPALALDASAEIWPIERADAIICINMIHIAPWSAAEGLLNHAPRLLPPGGPLVLYGPFLRETVPLAPSNAAFDADLRASDPAWGLRRLADVTSLAADLAAPEVVEVPANNLVVVYRRL